MLGRMQRTEHTGILMVRWILMMQLSTVLVKLRRYLYPISVLTLL